MRTRRSVAIFATCSVLGLAAVPGFAGTGRDANPPTDERVESLSAAEAADRMGMTPSEYERHSRALETIDAIESAATIDGAGYLGSEVDLGRGRVVVLWDEHEDPPPAHLTTLGKGGTIVEVHVIAPSQVVQDWLAGRGKPIEVPHVTGVSYSRAQAGFVVDVDAGTSAARMSNTQMQAALGLPAPVVTITARPADGGLLSRWNDSGAHNPGSRAINGPFNSPCTAAFKVRRDNGTDALLTAAHCHSGAFYNAGNWMGSVSNASYHTFNTTRDVGLISGDSNGYGSSVYTGWYNSSTLVNVTATATPSFGLSVCAGGAMSGEVCTGSIISNNGSKYGRSPVFTAQFVGATGGAGNMDSGGPMYTYYSSSSGTYLRPVGLISSGDAVAPCAGQPESSESNCFALIHGAQITTAQSIMGFDILASSQS